jgi:hypothetical protein
VNLWHLGAFPWTSADATDLGTVVADGDASAFPSYFLAASGNLLATGYTTSFEAPYPGRIALVDTAGTPDAAGDDVHTHLDAFANFSADFSGSGALLVEGASLDTAGLSDPTPAVYGYQPGSAESGLVAHGVGAASGYLARIRHPDGIVAMGGFSASFENQLYAIPPQWVDDGLAGTPFDLSTGTLVSTQNMLGVAGFADGVAFIAADENYAALGITRHALSLDASAVAAGSPEPVVTVKDACTTLLQIASFDDGLLVSLSDDLGTRLVHLGLE